jgi:polysaccharide biosynthesis PFTS motif protein
MMPDNMKNRKQVKLKEAHNLSIKDNHLANIRNVRKAIVKHEIDKLEQNDILQQWSILGINNQTYLSCSVQNLCNQLLNNQKLIKRIIMAHSNGRKLAFPLPKDWIDIFNENGIVVNKSKTLLLWHIYRIKKKLLNLKDQLLSLFFSLVAYFNIYHLTKQSMKYPFAYFHNFDNIHMEKGEFNLVNWIQDQGAIDNHFLVHSSPKSKDSVKLHYIENIFLGKSLRKLFINYIKLQIITLKIRNKLNNKYSIFIPSAEIYQTLLSFDTKHEMGNLYIFTESQRLAKPLWVFHLENINQEIIYIESSQSIEPVDLFGNNGVDDFELIDTWKKVWTVSEERKIYKKAFHSNLSSKYFNKGLPWMTDECTKIEKFTKPTIAIFDVEPHQDYYGISNYNYYGLQNVDFSIKFLEDIVHLACIFDCIVLHKPKRNIGKRRFLEYSETLKLFTKEFHQFYTLLNPSISLHKIAAVSDFVIATPFTSAALVTNETNLHKTYYDPFCLGLTDMLCSKLGLIEGKDNLENWLKIKLKGY